MRYAQLAFSLPAALSNSIYFLGAALSGEQEYNTPPAAPYLTSPSVLLEARPRGNMRVSRPGPK